MKANGKRGASGRQAGRTILAGGEYVDLSIDRVVRVLDSLPGTGGRAFTVEAVGRELPGQRWSCTADQLAPVSGRLEDGRTPDGHLAAVAGALDEATRLVQAASGLLGSGGATQAAEAVGHASRRLVEAGEELAAIAAVIRAA